MPDRVASSDYKLFPSKYKRGGARAKKSPEKLNVDLPSRRPEYQYRIMSRNTTSYQQAPQPRAPSMSLTEKSWPSILSRDKQNNLYQAASQRPHQPKSFADMVKVQKLPVEKEKPVVAASVGSKGRA